MIQTFTIENENGVFNCENELKKSNPKLFELSINGPSEDKIIDVELFRNYIEREEGKWKYLNPAPPDFILLWDLIEKKLIENDTI